MRIAIAGIVHETNIDCKDQTQLSDFYILRGEKMMRMRGTQTQSGAAIDTCQELGLTPVPIMVATTQPSGIIAADACHELKTEVLEGLARTNPAVSDNSGSDKAGPACVLRLRPECRR